jgi:acyl-CoA thioesterase-1
VLIACGGGPTENPVKEGLKDGQYRVIVAFGNSIVEGYNLEEGWPEILGKSLASRYPAVRVFNAGRSGDTAADGLSRLERDVLKLEPDLVLVAFGLNDMRHRRSPEEFRKDLESIIDGVTGKGAQAVLLTTTRLARGAALVTDGPDRYNEIIARVAGDRGLFLVDVYGESSELNTPRYMQDLAHPNQEGAVRLAGIVEEILLR